MSISRSATTISPSMFRSCAICGATGKSDFKGEFFTMNDCRVSPQPSVP
ncbi:Pyrimidine monooxygenase RutA [Leclercia adecarboxylata]|uniref:Pyrimidine monooxygenase RutA n=1 Tax=Leclercia adecarboxylata TaxID=83655 RepID=A0A4U9HS28_9ENTR|nr:Pyrimidine monooxygenase RutA [Leclercia adecarboxylata]